MGGGSIVAAEVRGSGELRVYDGGLSGHVCLLGRVLIRGEEAADGWGAQKHKHPTSLGQRCTPPNPVSGTSLHSLR